MKSLMVTLLLLSTTASFASTQETHNVITPVQEIDLLRDLDEEILYGYKSELTPAGKFGGFDFAQTQWNECTSKVKGNFLQEYPARSGKYRVTKCRKRGISVILKKYIDNHMLSCVSAGTKAMGVSESVRSFSIIHEGIPGDLRHNPRSLHAQRRAIDIREFRIKLSTLKKIKANFRTSAHQSFFNAFRSCWGKVVKKYNGCPYNSGTPSRTGSIGKEDKRHQNHMHTSIPVCSKGSYSSGYFKK